MVSFSCENCGDVLTKKKLDAHRNHCYGASFTCLDCMVHFRGTDYRSHTSCITEDQKYQGALYREKASKSAKRKSVSIVEPGETRALVPRAAYVEDAPDTDPLAPPQAPSPPPAAPARPAESVNVFDYLVAESSPNASRTSLGGTHEPMLMKKGAPSVFKGPNEEKAVSRHSYRNSQELIHDDNYKAHGFSYGTETVKPAPYHNANGSLLSLEFMTPAAKATRAKLDRPERPTHSRTNSGNTSDKKRKRGAVDEQRYEYEGDTVMPDALKGEPAGDTPALAHSGLTGGLGRLMSRPDPFPPSPVYSDDRDLDREQHAVHGISDQHEDPASPLKRSRRSKDDSGLGISIKGRAGRVMSMVGVGSVAGALAAITHTSTTYQNGVASHSHANRDHAGTTVSTTAASTRARRTSSSTSDGRGGRQPQTRERKKHKVHRQHGSTTARHERSSHSHRSSRRRAGSTGASPHDREEEDDNHSYHHNGDEYSQPRRKLKAIEYHKYADESGTDSGGPSDDDAAADQAGSRHRHRTGSGGGGGGGSMVVFGQAQRVRLRAESFLSVVTKGPESEKGYSVNKALKRWHRDGGFGGAFAAGGGGTTGGGTTNLASSGGAGLGIGSKQDEEKELWRCLRLKKNDRGEIVVFCG